MSTPMPTQRAGKAWTGGVWSEGLTVRNASTTRDANLIRKPNMYDGQSSWEAYYAQFCIIANMNRWNDMEKAAFLATSLKGTALQVLVNLSSDRRQNVQALVGALSSRFGTSHRTEISKVRFRNRVRQRDEELPALAEDIERLARLAYTDAPAPIIETLARDQFVDSLPDDDMRLRLRQERPPTLQKALVLALELESFHLANRQHRVRISREAKVQVEPKQHGSASSPTDVASRMEAASKQIAQSMERLEALMRDRGRPRSTKGREPRGSECWKCGAEGHFRKDCPRRSPPRKQNAKEEVPRHDRSSAGGETSELSSTNGNSGNAK
jgi:hypothetical protein